MAGRQLTLTEGVRYLSDESHVRYREAVAAKYPHRAEPYGMLGRMQARVGDWKQAAETHQRFRQTHDRDYPSLLFDTGTPIVETDHLPFDQFPQFTIEAWVRNWTGPVAQQGEIDAGDTVFRFYDMASGWHRANASKNSPPKNFLVRHLAQEPGWRHLAFVFDGKKYYSFVDGRRQGKASAAPPTKE